MIVLIWLTFFFFWIFVLGCAIGSFLNVVIYRLPRGKNLFWPSSRCGACLKAISSRDNVPLLSYLRLRGRCRTCGAPFSMRYFWVELLTGVIFVGLYAVEVGWNIHGIGTWGNGFWYLTAGGFAPYSWPFFIAHALLASLLLAAVACLLDTGSMPQSLAITGAVAGLCWNLLYPWPSPAHNEGSLRPGFIPWPVWWPLPAWLPAGGVLLGLLTGLAGILFGPTILRLVNALHRAILAREVFGPASAALLLLAGGFLGWQLVAVALVLALLFVQPITRLGHAPAVAFPLALVAGLVIAWFGWAWLGPLLQPWLFSSPIVYFLPALLTIAVFIVGSLLRPITVTSSVLPSSE